MKLAPNEYAERNTTIYLRLAATGGHGLKAVALDYGISIERVFDKPPSGLPPLVVETSDGMHRDGVLIVHHFRLHVTEDEDGKQWFSYRDR